MNQLPPAGWNPDPEDPSQLRYWDGAAWTEHRHPNPRHDDQTAPISSAAATSAQPVRPWYKKKRFVLPAAGVGLVLFASAVSNGDDSANSPVSQPVTTVTVSATQPSSAAPAVKAPTTTTTTVAAPAPKPPAPPKVESGEFGPQTAEQRKVLAAVSTGQKALEAADNELQQGAALRARSKSMCAALGDRKVKGWTGKVEELGANGDGKGVLRVLIAEDVEVKTWNNDFSDIGDETLIDPESPLYQKVLKLKEGQLVSFSGTFLPGDEGECVKEGSLSLRGKLGSPDFLFRFADVKGL